MARSIGMPLYILILMSVFWKPKKPLTVKKRPDEYPVWRDNGWLIATPGESTDYKRIQRDIEDAHVKNPFYEIGHDPYHAEQLTANLLDEGVNVVEVPQKNRTFKSGHALD